MERTGHFQVLVALVAGEERTGVHWIERVWWGEWVRAVIGIFYYPYRESNPDLLIAHPVVY